MVHQSCEMAPPIHLGVWAMAIARVVLGVGKGVLFREVSSVQVYILIDGFHCTHTHLEVRAVLGEIRDDCLSQSDSREVQSLYTATVHPCIYTLRYSTPP